MSKVLEYNSQIVQLSKDDVESLLEHSLKDDLNILNEESMRNNVRKHLEKLVDHEISTDAFKYFIERQFDNLVVSTDSLNIKEVSTRLTDEPIISVIITTFNRVNYLIEAVESILNQTYRNIELIVIDDASNDNTEEIMNKYLESNNRIIYKRLKQNMGPGNNRREAFKLSKGKYVLFLDDDDFIIDPDYFAQAIDFHEKNEDLSFVSANSFIDLVRNNKLEPNYLKLPEVVNRDIYFLNLEKLGYPKPNSTLTTIFKREVLMAMDIINMKMVNDVSIYLRALLFGDAGFIDKVVGVYRVHGNNITFNLEVDFVIDNLEEKRIIKEMALVNERFSGKVMKKWFEHNVIHTLDYFLGNSAKKPSDYYEVITWMFKNCRSAIVKVIRHNWKNFLKVLIKQ